MSRLEWFACVAIAAAVASVLSFRAVYEPDLWWHLAQGREAAAGHIARSNMFSAAFGDYRQHYTSWLFELSMYEAWEAMTDAGVQIVQAMLLTAAFVVTWAACRRSAGRAASAAVLALGVFVIEPRAIPRPHLVSFVGIAAILLLVEESIRLRSARPLRWAIPIVALWSNFHVESAVGVLLVGCVAAGEFIRPSFVDRRDALRLAAVTALCAVALTANPYGIGVFRYFYENLSVPQIINIGELRPPYLPAYRAFFAYAAVLGLLLAAQPSKLRAWEVFVTLLTAIAGFRYLRLTPLLFLATAPLASRRLSNWIPRPFDPRAVVITAVAASLLLSRLPLASYARSWHPGNNAFSVAPVFSAAAAAFARDHHIEGPVFNSFNLGGYLAWTLYPSVRTFQDSRLQAYPPSHFPSIMSASESQDSWNTLVRDVRYAFVATQQPNQLSGVGRFPPEEWELVYGDSGVQIFRRR